MYTRERHQIEILALMLLMYYMCVINQTIIRDVFRLGIAAHISQWEHNAFFPSLMVLEIY